MCLLMSWCVLGRTCEVLRDDNVMRMTCLPDLMCEILLAGGQVRIKMEWKRLLLMAPVHRLYYLCCGPREKPGPYNLYMK